MRSLRKTKNARLGQISLSQAGVSFPMGFFLLELFHILCGDTGWRQRVCERIKKEGEHLFRRSPNLERATRLELPSAIPGIGFRPFPGTLAHLLFHLRIRAEVEAASLREDKK